MSRAVNCMMHVASLATLLCYHGGIPLVQANQGNGNMEVNITAILDALQTGYDKRIRPNYGGVPVEVGVTMFVLSISQVSEVQMDFTLDFYFRQFWHDPRLSFTRFLDDPNFRTSRNRPDLDVLTVGVEYINRIWVPDTFFANEKQSYLHTATTSNEFLRISNNGSIYRSIRLTITAGCPMDLRFFPMDRQLCSIEIESFGYTVNDIKYTWMSGLKSVGVSNDVSLPQFKVLGYRQKSKEVSLSSGNYSRLACEIQFVRSMGYYLIQIYIPSGLIVVISWVSFWLNRNASPARVALGITTVLTMTTLMSSTNAALPKISYAKSIDVYLGACFVMVFAALVEYATVGYMGKRIQMRKTRMLAMQKLAEQKKASMAHWSEGAPSHAPPHGTHGYPVMDPEWTPKQASGTTRRMQAEVRYKINDPKMHTKGGTLESTVNGGRTRGMMIGGPPGHPGVVMGAPPGTMRRGTPSSGLGGGGQLPEGIGEAVEGDLEAPASFTPHSILGTAHHGKDLNRLCGLTPSDIDKYSRVVFPVCFICFNLMYWIIYLHISDEIADDLILIEHV